MKTGRGMIEGRKLVEAIAGCALDKKAENVVGLRVEPQCGIADWFVICEGDNRVQTGAIADAIVEGVAQKGLRPWHVEGKEDGRWVLIDFSDVIVHIMLPEIRGYYALERMWSSAERIAFG
jgi:ribosome-associated protein